MDCPCGSYYRPRYEDVWVETTSVHYGGYTRPALFLRNLGIFS